MTDSGRDAPAPRLGRLHPRNASGDNREVATRVSSAVFVGRGTELAALQAALERASAGHLQGVLIAGDSGVGKTRALHEFRLLAEAAGARWLSGECLALAEGELPYAPITAALRDITEPEDLDEVAQSAPELARLLPRVGLGRRPDPAESADGYPAASGGEFAQALMFEQFLSLLARLSSERPLVLAIEDLHWADGSTRDLLSFLIRNARSQALLVICTYRSDELHRHHSLRPFLAEHKRLGWVELVELQPFTASELRAQVEGILGAPPDPGFAARLFERSEGNAFFSEVLLAAASGGERFPATIRDALMVRVETLSAPTQKLLRVAASAGRRVSHSLLAAVSELPEPGLSEALREAVGHQVLVQDREHESYAFRHALLAETVYADLLPGERTGLHLALAQALAADPELAADADRTAAGELAFHWRACHRLDAALSASVQAGLGAESTCAFAEASRQFENALELWDRVDDAGRLAGMDHPAVLLRAAENASLNGQADRAMALARSAAAETDAVDDPLRAGLVQERLGHFLWLSGDSEGAIDALRQAIDVLPADPPSVERARVLAGEAKMLMLHGRPEESRSLCNEAISIARGLGARPEEGQALNTLGVDLLVLGGRRQAIEHIGEAKSIAEECALQDLGRAYGNLVEALDQDGRLEEAVRLGVEGVERLRPLGQRGWIAYLLGWVSSELVRLGRLDEAQEFVVMGLETPIEGIDLAVLHCVAAEIALHRGDLRQARASLDRAERAGGRTTDVMMRAMLTDRSALLGVVGGDPDRTAALVDEAGVGDDEYVFYTARVYALALRAHADRAERARAVGDADTIADASRSGRAILGRFERFLAADRWLDSPPAETVARSALARAELGRLDGPPDPDGWDSVAARWRELGFPLDLAYARWRHAEAALGAGRGRAGAAEPLREAARLTKAAGASLLAAEIGALARRARIELGEQTEATPHQASAHDGEPFGLTDRELGVLALVAQGRTNREIGDELFISPKTASAHVSHILSKLEVRSRTEAATVAHRLGLLPSSSPSRGAAD